MASKVPIAITLTDEDRRRIVPLLMFAVAEARSAMEPDALIRPVDPTANRTALAWAESLLGRLGVEP